MVKILKNHDFPLQRERLYTSATIDALDLIHFRASDAFGDEASAPFQCPENWSLEAAESLAGQAAFNAAPAQTRPIEENTIPSWLWKRTAEGREHAAETGAQQIFNRVAGAAAYTGWKKGLFADENEARIFFDETRYMLAQRLIAIDPKHMASLGIDWAYGIEPKIKKTSASVSTAQFEAKTFAKKGTNDSVTIRNASIDAILADKKDIRAKWRRYLAGGVEAGFVSLRFADIAADWNASPVKIPAPRAAIDLAAFRREDGSVDIDRLRHAARLLTVLLDMHGEQLGGTFAVGLHNLAPALMSQGLAYDSDAGRATASALAAIVTAEIYATSARLAGLLGPSLDFAAHRDIIMRSLRNHRRAAWGDRNDYEKISVLPVPLALDANIDLALVASARRLFDDAFELVKQHGLRHGQTDISAAPALAFFMESVTQETGPMPSLTVMRATETDIYRRDIHPAAAEALVKLGYDADARKAIVAHIAGTRTLAHAPGIDHAALRRRGFTDDAIEQVENYLPWVNDIKLAFTPWILGEEFYREALKIPAGKTRDPRFDLLQHLGFKTEDIQAANKFCYGRGTALGAKGLRSAHVSVLAQSREVSAEARIRMAAAVQGFVAGQAGLQVKLREDSTVDECEQILLAAWRQGVKSLTIEFDAAPGIKSKATVKRDAMGKTRIRAPQQPEYRTTHRAGLRSRSKASGRLVEFKDGHQNNKQTRKNRDN